MFGPLLTLILWFCLILPAEAAETDWLQHPMQRAGFNANATINEDGLDVAGWFHRTKTQRVGPEVILALANRLGGIARESYDRVYALADTQPTG